MKHYDAAECIFDTIAACGPQELGELRSECRRQCTTNEWLDGGTAEDRADTLNNGIQALEKAGIIEREWGVFDLSDYGYELVAGITQRLRDYEAHRRAALG